MSDNGGIIDGSLGSWSVRAIVGTMLPVLVVLSVLEMGSGLVLHELEQTFLDRPTLLVLVPVMIAMGGNLGSILSSRLSTRLHLGTLNFSLRDPVILTNVVAVLALALTVFTALGVSAYALSLIPVVDVGGGMTLRETFLVSVVSGMLLAVVAVVLSISMTFVSYKLGFDPDDTTIPVVTNLCDILGVVILAVVSLLVL
ncbi:MAG: magnesium transporter [Halobacteriales archaeon]|nr:magnesium transporter [Halobacteriales archaeon]